MATKRRVVLFHSNVNLTLSRQEAEAWENFWAV